MRFYLIILDPLPCSLKFRKNLLLLIPPCPQLIPLLRQLLQLSLNLICLQRNTLSSDRLLLDFELTDTAIQLSDRLRHRIHLKTKFRSRLIHKINRLIRQKSIGDISVRKLDSRNQGIILNTHLVMILISLLQAAHDRNRSSRRRLLNHHHLETPLKSLIRLEILLILIQGGRTYSPELASGKCRLKNIRRIHCAGRTTSTDQGMNFINKEDNLSLTIHNFLNNTL